MSETERGTSARQKKGKNFSSTSVRKALSNLDLLQAVGKGHAVAMKAQEIRAIAGDVGSTLYFHAINVPSSGVSEALMDSVTAIAGRAHKASAKGQVAQMRAMNGPFKPEEIAAFAKEIEENYKFWGFPTQRERQAAQRAQRAAHERAGHHWMEALKKGDPDKSVADLDEMIGCAREHFEAAGKLETQRAGARRAFLTACADCCEARFDRLADPDFMGAFSAKALDEQETAMRALFAAAMPSWGKTMCAKGRDGMLAESYKKSIAAFVGQTDLRDMTPAQEEGLSARLSRLRALEGREETQRFLADVTGWVIGTGKVISITEAPSYQKKQPARRGAALARQAQNG